MKYKSILKTTRILLLVLGYVYVSYELGVLMLSSIIVNKETAFLDPIRNGTEFELVRNQTVNDIRLVYRIVHNGGSLYTVDFECSCSEGCCAINGAWYNTSPKYILGGLVGVVIFILNMWYIFALRPQSNKVTIVQHHSINMAPPKYSRNS